MPFSYQIKVRRISALAAVWTSAVVLVFLVMLLAVACTPRQPNMYLPGEPDITEYTVYYNLGEYHPYKPVSVVADSPLVFITEEQDAIIHVLDWDLKPVSTIGRKGNGPGEFGMITAFDIRNDTLAVLDTWNMQVVFRSIQDEYYSSFSLPFSAKWGSITYAASGNLLITNYERTSPVLVKEYTIDGELTQGFFDAPSVDYGITMAQAVTVRAQDRMIALFLHQPMILVDGDRQVSWDYQLALTEGYPFLQRIFRMKQKAEEQGYGMPLFAFGKGVPLGDLLITPGPMYNLNVIDTETGALLVINTGQLSQELGPWGYNTFDDLAIRGETLIAVCSAASAVVVINLRQVLSAIETGQWLEPKIM